MADGNTIKGEKGVGLVSDVFQDTGKLEQLQGQIALGHVLYAANTDGLPANAQPLLMRYRHGYLAIVHNGQLVNGQQLRCQLEDEGSIFQTTSDSEVMAHLIARSGETDIVTAVKKSLLSLQGAYTYLLMTPQQLIAARDPHGFRPLSWAGPGGVMLLLQRHVPLIQLVPNLCVIWHRAN